MNQWLKRVRDAVLLGFAWAVVWAPIAVLLGVFIIDPDNSMDEMWFVIGAYPGFLCGVIFSALRGLGEGRRRLGELSLPRAGVWGSVGGALVGALPFAMGSPNPQNPAWLGLAVVGSITLLSAVSAVGSVVIARMVKKRELRGA
jgi:hypothetical protein